MLLVAGAELEDELIALGIIDLAPEAVETVVEAAEACGVPEEQIEAALQLFAGG